MRLDFKRIADCIESQTEPEPFSGVVYLTKGDEVLFERECGFAVKSESILNRVNTRFQMASGSKVFTGVAICQLVERGELQFDTVLSDCLDAIFPDYAPEITIHHLLTHSSGITSYFEEDVDPDYEAFKANYCHVHYRWICDLLARGRRAEATRLARQAMADPFLQGSTAVAIPQVLFQ